MILVKNNAAIDRSDFFYPSSCYIFNENTDLLKKFSTVSVYGVCLGPTQIEYNNSKLNLNAEAHFSLAINNDTKKFLLTTKSKVVVFVRYGYKCLNHVGLDCEPTGRLTYIDGCTDSTLICPPRFGDPSLNLLYFPEKTSQTFHSHPTLRFGVVLEGAGFAEAESKSYPLKKHDVFSISENELHRFRTESKTMRLIAYHPDSDFGPKDNDHAMLNRTYINIK